jgi:AhpD family alkylhydroperoxidase
VPYLTPAPWVARLALTDLNNGGLVHTGFELTQLVFLVVSQDNSCRFCYDAQRALMRLLGFPEEQIERLQQDLFTAELDEHDRLAIDFARRLSRANPLPSRADLEALRDRGFSDGEIRELAFIAADTIVANRVTTIPAIPPGLIEQLTSRWWVRWVRPLIRRSLLRTRRRGVPEFLAPEQKQGPYSYMVLAFDGLPTAGILRGILDEAWASQILSRRTKALVFAVVARALGCTLAERESVRLLAAEGLDEAEVERVLSHLASPVLDPVESSLLPLARESIRYRPAQIQKRAREVREKLTAEQFVEAVGIMALANGFCRMEPVCEPG